MVPVKVKNPAEKARPATFPREITLHANDETFLAQDLDLPNLYHRDRSLKLNEPLSGVLPYEVPADTTRRDVEVVLETSYSRGDVRVVWGK